MPRPLVALSAACLVLGGLAGCTDATPLPLQPTPAASRSAAPAAGTDERALVSPRLAQVNARLAAAGSRLRVAKAELRMGPTWDGATSTIVLADDRVRGNGSEWVRGDPARDGRDGVTYQVASHRAVLPFVIRPDRQTIRAATAAELDAHIEEAVAAWRALRCSDAPLTRVPIPAGTDPDLLDNVFRGAPIGADYAQTADIVESGWQSRQWFRNVADFFFDDPAAGDATIGITFTFSFVDENGEPTDIDRNGKTDTGLVEIYYNAAFVWDDSGLPDLRVVDFFSILAHETGHGLGLGHFGKMFITRHDAADGLSVSDVKFAPYALMNAGYITGRNPIVGNDVAQFCAIWGTR